MKRLLYHIRQIIYTVFSFCYFLVLSLYLTIRGFILLTIGGSTDAHKRHYHKLLQRQSAFAIKHVPGTTFSYSNPTGESFDKPCMIICNHQSHLDLLAVMMLTPNLIILTKEWVWKNPFYGKIIRYADYFPIRETEQMISQMSEKIEKGYSIMIFPEGTRSSDSHIQRFHKGAFYIAERLDLDIIPLYIEGFGDVLPKKKFCLQSGSMKLEVMPRMSRDVLKEMGGYRIVRKQMQQLYRDKRHEEVCNNR